MDVNAYMAQLGQQARAASRQMASATTVMKNNALLAIAEQIQSQRQQLMAANASDMENGRSSGLEAALLDRLELTPARIDTMIEGLQQVAAHPFAEIRDNTIAADMLPIDLLRAKLSFFGATRFDPRSDRWVRITMFQGAPYPDEPDLWGQDDWMLPA